MNVARQLMLVGKRVETSLICCLTFDNQQNKRHNSEHGHLHIERRRRKNDYFGGATDRRDLFLCSRVASTNQVRMPSNRQVTSGLLSKGQLEIIYSQKMNSFSMIELKQPVRLSLSWTWIHLSHHQTTDSIAYAKERRSFLVGVAECNESSPIVFTFHTPSAEAWLQIHFCVSMWDFSHGFLFFAFTGISSPN